MAVNSLQLSVKGNLNRNEQKTTRNYSHSPYPIQNSPLLLHSGTLNTRTATIGAVLQLPNC
jgi:hypothetical protein